MVSVMVPGVKKGEEAMSINFSYLPPFLRPELVRPFEVAELGGRL